MIADGQAPLRVGGLKVQKIMRFRGRVSKNSSLQDALVPRGDNSQQYSAMPPRHRKMYLLESFAAIIASPPPRAEQKRKNVKGARLAFLWITAITCVPLQPLAAQPDTHNERGGGAPSTSTLSESLSGYVCLTKAAKGDALGTQRLSIRTAAADAKKFMGRGFVLTDCPVDKALNGQRKTEACAFANSGNRSVSASLWETYAITAQELCQVEAKN